MTNPTRFGIIGTGRITRRLVADLQSTDGVSVTAIASRSSRRARWYADQYGITTAVEGYQSLLDREDVDAVYISLPPSLHAEWSIAAAQCGNHILCEKPLSVSVAETRYIEEAARVAGVRWLDATAWLHHPRTEAFAKWIAEGRFGKIGHISASVSFYQPFQSDDHRLSPALGGGCILDLGWYAAGLICFATGTLPVAVNADAVMVDGVAQRLTAMMRFDDGATATISCGYDTATRKWFEVAGSQSSLICDDFTRPWASRPARCWIHDSAGNVTSENFEGSQERIMIERLTGEEPLERFQQQAIDTQRLVETIQRSVREHGATHSPHESV